MAASRRALSIMETMMAQSGSCPCHGGGGTVKNLTSALGGCSTHHPMTTDAAAPPLADYAFEAASSTVRFGPGVTVECGYDMANLGAKNVLLVTDSNLATLPPVITAEQSLKAAGVKYDVYADVRVEPTDTSMKDCIAFAQRGGYDAFLAVGGGSVMDTAKVANLFTTYPEYEFLDFVNAPVGKGLPVPGPVKPLVAVPTTAGTGSETTGVAIMDMSGEGLAAKSGIANRFLRPYLGIIDPLNMHTMPREVIIASGFDVLCHALESFTAIPYHQRTPRPTNPALRPAYQGANPVSDVWCTHALQIAEKFFVRSVEDSNDTDAKSYMALAATMAGVGFGNAGVHMCHGLSYPISSLGKSWKHPGYKVPHSLVPHGISVVMTAPAVFKFTAPTNPMRHLQAAALLGADVSTARPEDAGPILADTLKKYMDRLNVPEGLSAIGFSNDDIPQLVKGTLPQQRVLNIAPTSVMEEDIASVFEASM